MAPEAETAALPRFLMEVRRIRLLTAAEEINLAKRVERGDRQARSALIEGNLRLVIAIARRYRGRGLPLLDLIQEGCIGLIRAVDRYDRRRGYRFSTYGAWVVEAAIKDALPRSTRSIRLPPKLLARLSAVKAAEERLVRQLQRHPSSAELAAEVGGSPSEIDHICQLARQPLSLQAPKGRRGTAKGSASVTWPEDYDLVLLRDLVGNVLSLLDQRERAVIERRYGLDGDAQTLTQIGRDLALTGERVRQIQQETLERLRAVFDVP